MIMILNSYCDVFYLSYKDYGVKFEMFFHENTKKLSL